MPICMEQPTLDDEWKCSPMTKIILRRSHDDEELLSYQQYKRTWAMSSSSLWENKKPC